jgi:putative endonuclease
MWYVYFLELTNEHIYVGFSQNLRERLNAPNAGKVPSTKPFLPVKLKTYIALDSKEKTLLLEKYFKTASGKALAKSNSYAFNTP